MEDRRPRPAVKAPTGEALPALTERVKVRLKVS